MHAMMTTELFLTAILVIFAVPWAVCGSRGLTATRRWW